jgi:uncharacterized protein with NAD-binding domain and iron-sulfur cluster
VNCANISLDYVEHGGDLALPPPFLAERTLLRCFSLTADQDCLQRLVASTLNRAGAPHLRPLSSSVLVVFAEIARASSAGAAGRGWFRETDVAFWVPLLDARDRPRVSWFLPYVFVDNPYAMAAGRETLGFAKTIGQFDLPVEGGVAPYRVATMHLPSVRSSDEYRVLPLFEVSRADGDPRAHVPRVAALRSIARLTQLDAEELGARARIETSAADLAAFPRRREIPMVFLRQLRDASDPRRAAFQEVVEAPARLLRIRRGGILQGRYALRIDESESHPIGRDLGLSNEHAIEAAWWAEIDFVVDRGRRVETAPRRRAVVTSAAAAPRRIAVLGGGIGALSAVLALTAAPDWRSRYDIVVYQPGFRLGGKCASWRRPDHMQRIEEHGLHVWFGSYAHAFRMLRRCYAELARPTGAPLSTWREAFTPQQNFYLREQHVDGQWSTWRLELPASSGLPGDPDHEPTAEGLRRVVPAVVETLARELRRLAREIDPGLGAKLLGALAARDLLSIAGLQRARRLLGDAFAGELKRAAPLGHVVDLCLTSLIGMLRDQALTRGLASLDDEELSAWLERHGASRTTLSSGLVRALYDVLLAAEASPGGGRDLAAGTALRASFFVLNGYRGAYLWKMNAGMGEAVVAPIYEVLRRRGVTFRFFHRVDHLGLSEDGRSLRTILIGRQATVKGGGDYEPLVDVDGLPCWPHAPRWEQLEEGEALAAADTSFESASSAAHDVEQITLRAGRDFDDAILGIPVAALRSICGDLVAAHPAWSRMLATVRTTATVNLQTWLSADARALGRESDGDLQGGDPAPFSTYADMSHLLPAERWPEASVKHAAYFCGPLPDNAVPFEERGDERLARAAAHLFEQGARDVWPAAYPNGTFDWNLLAAPEGVQGRARLAAQYLRANVEPTDRYTLTCSGSTACRLAPDGSGIEGLYLAGDWVKNALDVGCIEGAVLAGEACAEAVARDAEGDRAHPRTQAAPERIGVGHALAAYAIAVDPGGAR